MKSYDLHQLFERYGQDSFDLMDEQTLLATFMDQKPIDRQSLIDSSFKIWKVESDDLGLGFDGGMLSWDGRWFWWLPHGKSMVLLSPQPSRIGDVAFYVYMLGRNEPVKW